MPETPTILIDGSEYESMLSTLDKAKKASVEGIMGEVRNFLYYGVNMGFSGQVIDQKFDYSPEEQGYLETYGAIQTNKPIVGDKRRQIIQIGPSLINQIHIEPYTNSNGIVNVLNIKYTPDADQFLAHLASQPAPAYINAPESKILVSSTTVENAFQDYVKRRFEKEHLSRYRLPSPSVYLRYYIADLVNIRDSKNMKLLD